MDNIVMIETTLIYLKKNNKYLMLHRTKKNDINKCKWLGIGGKLESNKMPDECIKREVKKVPNITREELSEKLGSWYKKNM